MLFGVVPLEEEFITKSHFGTVGLGFLSEDQDESFLHQLVNLNYIDYKVFYIKFYDDKKGHITFGNYPLNKPPNNQFKYRTCNLLLTKNQGEPNQRWECPLKAIFFEDSQGNFVFELINDRISFNLSSTLLLVPSSFFDKFINFYFKQLLETNQCHLETLHYFVTVICNDEINIDNLGEINYIIGKWTVKFKPKELFRFNDFYGQQEFVIKKHITLNTFIFGTPFFHSRNVIFDKENKQIGIYS